MILKPVGTVAVAVKVCIGLALHSALFPPVAGALGAPVIVKVTAVLVKLEQVPLLNCA